MSEVKRTPGTCSYCGGYHPQSICSLVAAMEYHPNGTVKRVEFKEARQNKGRITPCTCNPHALNIGCQTHDPNMRHGE